MSYLAPSLRRERDEYARQNLYWCPKCQTYEFGEGMQKRPKGSRYGFGPYCLSCERERQREYRTTEKSRKYRQRYYQDNKEELLAYSREWRQRNRDHLKEYDRNRPNRDERREQVRLHWRALPRAEKRARAKKKYLRYRERQIARQKEHYHTPEGKIQHQVWRKRYVARRANLQSDYTPQEWKDALAHWEHKCAYCRQAGVTDQDHFIPVSKSGGYTASNIVPACDHCNSSKRNIDAYEWAEYEGIPVEHVEEIEQWLKEQ